MRRKRTYGITALVLLLTMLWPAAARADILTEGIPQTSGTSYIVIEGSTGEILFGRNYTEQAEPASITKIMTAMLALQSGKLNDTVTITQDNVTLEDGSQAVSYTHLQAAQEATANEE